MLLSNVNNLVRGVTKQKLPINCQHLLAVKVHYCKKQFVISNKNEAEASKTKFKVTNRKSLDNESRLREMLSNGTFAKEWTVLRKEKQQQAAKKKALPFIPGTVSLQVLGVGANGAPAAVYLFTDQTRYLFNCGEGTQRLAHEHKTKLARLEHIFVTRNTWSSIGGLPGLLLTVQDAGVKQLSLHGPPYLDNILKSMKRFVILKNLVVNTANCMEDYQFEDDVMKVKAVPLYNLEKEKQNDERLMFPHSEQVAIAYICQLKPKPGALILEKCVDMGVPPGPLLGLLKNGIDVTLDCGKVVKSKDVSEDNETPVNFIFIDVPTVGFLSSLQQFESEFDQLTNSETKLMIHFTPASVLKNNIYQSFLQKCPSGTQHIYLNDSQNAISGYLAAHRIQYQLNQLNPKVFPILNEAGQQTSDSLTNSLKKNKLSEEDNDLKQSTENDENATTITANTMTCYHLRPKKGCDHTLAPKLTPKEYIKETQQLPDFSYHLEKLKATYKGVSACNTNYTCYPTITFLGTGSCIPNKTRNVSAILLQSAEHSYTLLDCGEGTLGQIQRLFGQQQCEEVIKNLRIIYVSHLHADHHIGLIALLSERHRMQQQQQQQTDKILLLAPKQIESWLDFYNEHIYDLTSTYKLIYNASLIESPLPVNQLYNTAGVHSIQTCLVRHCPHAYGVSLTMDNNSWNEENVLEPVKVTYSGDTMPCQDLIDLGLNSNILIHEATMEDDLINEAKIKTHSTMSQAIQQGKAMNAQYIILTHFSQRYAKLPRLQFTEDNTISNDMRNVAIAFDNMQITLPDLEEFHLMYPAMRTLFAEHADLLEEKALKREMKLHRKRKLMIP